MNVEINHMHLIKFAALRWRLHEGRILAGYSGYGFKVAWYPIMD